MNYGKRIKTAMKQNRLKSFRNPLKIQFAATITKSAENIWSDVFINTIIYSVVLELADLNYDFSFCDSPTLLLSEKSSAKRSLIE